MCIYCHTSKPAESPAFCFPFWLPSFPILLLFHSSVSLTLAHLKASLLYLLPVSLYTNNSYNSWHWWSSYHEPSLILGALDLTLFIFTQILQGGYNDVRGQLKKKEITKVEKLVQRHRKREDPWSRPIYWDLKPYSYHLCYSTFPNMHATYSIKKFFFHFWTHHIPCGISVPQPRIKPGSMAVKAEVSTTEPPGNSHLRHLLNISYWLKKK